MFGSSHIQSVLIGVKYQNCCRTLDVYLLFAIWMGQIQSKFTCPSIIAKNPKFGDNFDIRPQLEHFKYEMKRT